MSDQTNAGTDMREELLQRHRKEKKELQAETTKMKYSVPKSDKKRRKEVTTQIATMEADLEAKHSQELKDFDSNHEVECITEAASEVTVDEKTWKPSKAQRRRDKQAEKEKEREKRILEQEKENLKGPRHLEYQKIKSILLERNLALSEVPSDGDCLYAAIVHQLNKREIPCSVSSLRQQTADYMRFHKDRFLPFTTHPQTGEALSEDEFEDYCQKIESTPEWGGHLEIQVLSEVLNTPVEVVQAEGGSVVSGEGKDVQPIILCYHRHAYGLGEHYNSVRPWTKEDEEDENWTEPNEVTENHTDSN